VPIHPDLAQLLRAHLDTFGTGRDGRVFVGPRGGIVAEWIYLDVYHRARRRHSPARKPDRSWPKTPYALRHAAVSTWLNAGVAAPQVAEWAGHSVDVLLRVYAKCIAGQQDEAKRRILEATRPSVTGANP
jgi:integrase